MTNKILKICLIGKTNSGKSTLLNKIVGETVSITNKKINTTQEFVKGIINIKNIQIIVYDTPGINYLKKINRINKQIKTELWQSISESDIIFFIIDSQYINFNNIENTIAELKNQNKKIILIFNKIDLVDKKQIILAIKKLENNNLINSFFNISAKQNTGLKNLIEYSTKFSKKSKWIFHKEQITNKDEIFITNECTRNAILTYLHKELPYDIIVVNNLFKYLKNGDLKIKQYLKINNPRYKKIILGKGGDKIKKIRETSQKQINHILNCRVHLYLEIIKENA